LPARAGLGFGAPQPNITLEADELQAWEGMYTAALDAMGDEGKEADLEAIQTKLSLKLEAHGVLAVRAAMALARGLRRSAVCRAPCAVRRARAVHRLARGARSRATRLPPRPRVAEVGTEHRGQQGRTGRNR